MDDDPLPLVHRLIPLRNIDQHMWKTERITSFIRNVPAKELGGEIPMYHTLQECRPQRLKNGSDFISKLWISFSESDHLKDDNLFPYRYIKLITLNVGSDTIFECDGYILFLLHCLKLNEEKNKNYRQQGSVILPFPHLNLVAIPFSNMSCQIILQDHLNVLPTYESFAAERFAMIYDSIKCFPKVICEEVSRFCDDESHEKLTVVSLYVHRVLQSPKLRDICGRANYYDYGKHWKHFVSPIDENKHGLVEERTYSQSIIHRVLFVIEHPLNPFDFFDTKLHPLKHAQCVSIDIEDGKTFVEGDASYFFIEDKVQSDTFIPDVPIYSITFSNHFVCNFAFKLLVHVCDEVPSKSKLHVFIQYETKMLYKDGLIGLV